ncbi:MAG: PKD domain-containing protein [Bacteroidia bacterium]|nr:PKD domain-containing protein [Bacteroidia bacterium]
MRHLLPRFVVFVFTFGVFSLQTRAQLPPLQPEQDCINALPVCQNIFSQTNSYQGSGSIPNEINSGPSCLGSGELNSVWYIFTVQQSGNLCFSITPLGGFSDYDWAVYNLTNNNCSDIFTTPAMEVSCNFAPNLGCGGVTGPTGNVGGSCGGQNNPCIPVQAGQTYVINVSNFSSNNAGYTLNFSASTAVIFDNIPPVVDTIVANCSGQISAVFSENVVCSTVQPSDFAVTDLAGNSYTVTSVTGQACSLGGTFENQFLINTFPPFTTGTYIISVVDTIEDNCGNVAVFSNDTFQIVLPAISITCPTDTICTGNSATLSVTAQPGFTYGWSNGVIGATSITVSPAATTTYVVGATNAGGCLYSGTYTLTVIPPATSTFTAVPQAVCPDVPVTLTYTGTSLPVATFDWDFDSATVISGTGAGPYQVSWSTPGTHTPALTVSQYGCSSPVTAVPVTIYPIPTSDFASPQAVCLGLDAPITYTGTASGSAIYEWDFDSGIVTSGTGPGPYQVSWATPGVKNICLIVTENGCVSSVTCTPLRVDPLPVVSIAPESNQCLKGNDFSFAYNGPSQISAYAWDLGEPGATSTIAAPAYQYTSAGPKSITLTTTDQNGCVSTGSLEVTIYPNVEADFSYTPVCFGDTTVFSDLTQFDPLFPPANWVWIYGDGSAGVDAAPAHYYGAWGNYQVTLFTSSAVGCRDTIVKTVEVYDQPQADFSFVEACNHVPVTFQNQSKYSYPNINYTWDYGDGTGSTLSDPSHLFLSHGFYPVSLTITNDKGCRDVLTRTVEVYPLPVADFAVDPACYRQVHTFTNLTTVPAPGVPQRYEWTFNDGNATASPTPAHRFQAPGIYPVKLWVRTDDGCTDSLTRDVTVYPLPQVAFQVTPVCVSDSALLINRSVIQGQVTGDYLRDWRWHLGDAQQLGSLDEVRHRYREPGLYEVVLAVTSDKGCVDSARRTLEIYPLPAAPAVVHDTVCFGETASLPAPADAVAVEWFYQVQDTVPFQTAFSYVTPPVLYPVTYYTEAISREQCRSVRVPVTAMPYEDGQVQIVLSDSVLEIPQAIVRLGIAGTAQIEAWSWNLGDGNFSDASAPVHTYAYPGKYEIVANLLSAEGCELIASRVVEVKELIVAFIPSAFTPNGDGTNDYFYISTELISTLEFEVFNRWGQRVFRSNTPGFTWDGRSANGQPVPEGVYMYRLKATDFRGNPVLREGSLTILK